MKNFQKENPLLVIKGGIFEGKAVTTAEIMKLADLESREVLLSKLAGAMKGTMAKAARTFDALRIKLEAGSPAASEPAASTTEAEVPAPAATEATESVETPAETVAETPAAEEAAPAAEAVAETTETQAE
jgi:large subunit ribosomal protein L10